MRNHLTTRSGRRILLNTPEEDAAIDAAIASDPDTLEITSEIIAGMRPLRRAGRPPVEHLKEPVTMRVDADILAAIKATGKGWQTRVNHVLREAVKQGQFGSARD